MPRAGHDVAFQLALGDRPALMRALAGDGIKAAADVGDGDGLTVQLDLEAKGIIVRDTSSPLRLRKA